MSLNQNSMTAGQNLIRALLSVPVVLFFKGIGCSPPYRGFAPGRVMNNKEHRRRNKRENTHSPHDTNWWTIPRKHLKTHRRTLLNDETCQEISCHSKTKHSKRRLQEERAEEEEGGLRGVLLAVFDVLIVLFVFFIFRWSTICVVFVLFSMLFSKVFWCVVFQCFVFRPFCVYIMSHLVGVIGTSWHLRYLLHQNGFFR